MTTWRCAWLFALLTRAVADDESHLKIGFGSCSKPDAPTHVWDSVSKYKPEVWLWMGDNVYLDKRPGGFIGLRQAKQKYAQMRARPDYRKAMAKVRTVMGTWDDHDLGLDNAGAEFFAKLATEELMLDFLGFPPDHITRHRPGVYYSQTIKEGSGAVKVIMLDTRWFKTQETILGEVQWKWFEAELNDATPDFFVVVSSIQVTHDWGSSFSFLKRMEHWGLHPSELRRLLLLLQDMGQKQKPVLLLSGDVHHGDLVEVPKGCLYAQKAFADRPVKLSAPIVEATSSGITHSAVDRIYPAFFWTWLLKDVDVRSVAFHPRMARHLYLDKNWGSLDFDFAAKTVGVSVRDEYGRPVLSKTYRFQDLVAAQGTAAEEEGEEGLQELCPTEYLYPAPSPMRNLVIIVFIYLVVVFTLFVLPPLLVMRFVLPRTRLIKSFLKYHLNHTIPVLLARSKRLD